MRKKLAERDARPALSEHSAFARRGQHACANGENGVR